jgi:hypothetical protein
MDLWLEFEKDFKKNELIWIGEIHGIKENYYIYKYLIERFNFNQVALEYPQELQLFSKDKFLKYKNYKDGRFSQESFEFFNWLYEKHINLICFNNRLPTGDQQAQEDQMAKLLIKEYKTEKVLVITGNFHSQLTKQYTPNKILPMAALVKLRINNLLNIGISYAGGNFFNFGIKEINKNFVNFEDRKLSFGKITKNNNPLVSNKWWLHAGKATPVRLLS